MLRYLPATNLTRHTEGRVSCDRVEWRAGLPLKIFEDAALSTPPGASRAEWGDEWHTDPEWLRAAHPAKYSNPVVGLQEQLGRHAAPGTDRNAPGGPHHARNQRPLPE